MRRLAHYVRIASSVAAFVLIAGTMPALAQPSGSLPAVYDGVGLDQRLGTPIPSDLVFFDESGREVSIGSYLDGDTPILLTFVYHDCPMLCGVLLTELTKTLRQMEWAPGEEFELITVSFSGKETPALAAQQKERFLAMLGNPAAGAGWHFLTGDEPSILALADSIGFQYKWVEELEQYAHPAVLTFLTADGRVSRYIQSLSYAPRDVRMALLEASEGSIGSPIDLVALYCLKYDPDANSYVLHASNLMKLGGLLTVLLLGTALAMFWRREQARLAPFAE